MSGGGDLTCLVFLRGACAALEEELLVGLWGWVEEEREGHSREKGRGIAGRRGGGGEPSNIK